MRETTEKDGEKVYDGNSLGRDRRFAGGYIVRPVAVRGLPGAARQWSSDRAGRVGRKSRTPADASPPPPPRDQNPFLCRRATPFARPSLPYIRAATVGRSRSPPSSDVGRRRRRRRSKISVFSVTLSALVSRFSPHHHHHRPAEAPPHAEHTPSPVGGARAPLPPHTHRPTHAHTPPSRAVTPSSLAGSSSVPDRHCTHTNAVFRPVRTYVVRALLPRVCRHVTSRAPARASSRLRVSSLEKPTGFPTPTKTVLGVFSFFFSIRFCSRIFRVTFMAGKRVDAASRGYRRPPKSR